MQAINPATGEKVESYEPDTESEVEEALATAAATFEDWRTRSIRDRERDLKAVAETLRENTDEYAETITREMGKPITQARSEVEKCAWVCEHYAEFGDSYLTPKGHPSPAGATVETVYEPLGPVLAVMPWNFPFWQVFRFAAPALIAGNVCLLKHASNVPGCAKAIESVFHDAGIPEGAFQSLLISSEQVDEILEDDRVRATTVTGSGPAGSAVASKAGSELKKTVLELGGSDPFVVLPDADLDDAAATGVWGRTLNTGQSCIAAKRFLVHTDVYDDFLDRFEAEMNSLTIGDPMDPETELGPLCEVSSVETLHEQVTESVDAGATVLTGGEPLDRTGAYYAPTVLTDIPAGCPADIEELFGPVASVYEVSDESEAIELANDTQFGLAGSVWTEDRERGKRLAREIEAGYVFVNELPKSDPRVPFGGVKASGYGRELSGEGIKEFVNRKTVWVE